MKLDNISNSEVEQGARLCSRIKLLAYPHEFWSRSLADKISNNLKLMKSRSGSFYPDLNEVELLIKLNSFSDQDLREIIDLHQNRSGKTTVTNL